MRRRKLIKKILSLGMAAILALETLLLPFTAVPVKAIDCLGGTCPDGWSYGADPNAPQASCPQRHEEACRDHQLKREEPKGQEPPAPSNPGQAGDQAWGDCKNGGGSDEACTKQAQDAYIQTEHKAIVQYIEAGSTPEQYYDDNLERKQKDAISGQIAQEVLKELKDQGKSTDQLSQEEYDRIQKVIKLDIPQAQALTKALEEKPVEEHEEIAQLVQAGIGGAVDSQKVASVVSDILKEKGIVSTPTPASTRLPPEGGEIACVQDTKVCPDGSTVARVPPECDFAECPKVPSGQAPGVCAGIPKCDVGLECLIATTAQGLACQSGCREDFPNKCLSGGPVPGYLFNCCRKPVVRIAQVRNCPIEEARQCRKDCELKNKEFDECRVRLGEGGAIDCQCKEKALPKPPVIEKKCNPGYESGYTRGACRERKGDFQDPNCCKLPSPRRSSEGLTPAETLPTGVPSGSSVCKFYPNLLGYLYGDDCGKCKGRNVVRVGETYYCPPAPTPPAAETAPTERLIERRCPSGYQSGFNQSACKQKGGSFTGQNCCKLPEEVTGGKAAISIDYSQQINICVLQRGGEWDEAKKTCIFPESKPAVPSETLPTGVPEGSQVCELGLSFAGIYQKGNKDCRKKCGGRNVVRVGDTYYCPPAPEKGVETPESVLATPVKIVDVTGTPILPPATTPVPPLTAVAAETQTAVNEIIGARGGVPGLTPTTTPIITPDLKLPVAPQCPKPLFGDVPEGVIGSLNCLVDGCEGLRETRTCPSITTFGGCVKIDPYCTGGVTEKAPTPTKESAEVPPVTETPPSRPFYCINIFGWNPCGTTTPTPTQTLPQGQVTPPREVPTEQYTPRRNPPFCSSLFSYLICEQVASYGLAKDNFCTSYITCKPTVCIGNDGEARCAKGEGRETSTPAVTESTRPTVTPTSPAVVSISPTAKAIQPTPTRVLLTPTPAKTPTKAPREEAAPPSNDCQLAGGVCTKGCTGGANDTVNRGQGCPRGQVCSKEEALNAGRCAPVTTSTSTLTESPSAVKPPEPENLAEPFPGGVCDVTLNQSRQPNYYYDKIVFYSETGLIYRSCQKDNQPYGEDTETQSPTDTPGLREYLDRVEKNHEYCSVTPDGKKIQFSGLGVLKDYRISIDGKCWQTCLGNDLWSEKECIESFNLRNDKKLSQGLVKEVFAEESVAPGAAALPSEAAALLVYEKEFLEMLGGKSWKDLDEVEKTSITQTLADRLAKEKAVGQAAVRLDEKTISLATNQEGRVSVPLIKGVHNLRAVPIEGYDIIIEPTLDLGPRSSTIVDIGIREGQGRVLSIVFENPSLLKEPGLWLKYIYQTILQRISEIVTPVGAQEAAGSQVNEGIEPGGVSFILFYDKNDNGVRDADEENVPWAGVTIVLDEQTQRESLELLNGWNLIHLPFVPTDIKKASDLLLDIARSGGYVTTVATWEDGGWRQYSQRGEVVFGNDFEIQPGRAYFLLNHKEVTWFVAGYPLSQLDKPLTYALAQGWNGVGISVEGLKASGVLDGINVGSENATEIGRWDSGLWDVFVKRIYSQSDIQEYGNNFPIEATRGYMVKLKEETTWKP